MKKRGNPNQNELVKEIKSLGYTVSVMRNQICVDGENPMTQHEASEFIIHKKLDKAMMAIRLLIHKTDDPEALVVVWDFAKEIAVVTSDLISKNVEDENQ